jgi:hypothetical protein
MGEWKTIDTAPKDGTVILLMGGVYHGLPFPGRWDKSEFAPDRPWYSIINQSRLYEHCATAWCHVPQRGGDDWTVVTDDMPHETLKSLNADNQVLAYENGRYYNAYLSFEGSEGGWIWCDDADSEPNPSHYRPLPAPPSPPLLQRESCDGLFSARTKMAVARLPHG